jgi:hypothetical protein
MGYTTDFSGSIEVSGNMTEEQFDYINKFSDTRRMKRDVKILYDLYKGMYGKPNTSEMIEIDGVHVLNVYGNEGEYFVGSGGYDRSVIDQNVPPGQPSWASGDWEMRQELIKEGKCQPSLWCQWILLSENNVHPHNVTLQWDGGEKFYHYTEWLQYLINHFFKPWGLTLNGEIEWEGEESGDLGKIVVDDNEIEIKTGRVVYD